MDDTSALGNAQDSETLFAPGPAALFRPSEKKIKGSKKRDLMEKSRVVAAWEENDTRTGFSALHTPSAGTADPSGGGGGDGGPGRRRDDHATAVPAPPVAAAVVAAPRPPRPPPPASASQPSNTARPNHGADPSDAGAPARPGPPRSAASTSTAAAAVASANRPVPAADGKRVRTVAAAHRAPRTCRPIQHSRRLTRRARQVKVKCHYQDIRMVMVPENATFSQLLAAVCEKFAATSLSLNTYDAAGNAEPLADDAGVAKLLRAHPSGAQIWCSAKPR